MKRLLCIAAFLLSVNLGHSQNQALTAKLSNADSVFLISHRSIPHSSISVVDSSGKEISFPLLINGNLNVKSVQEKVLLKGAEIKQVAKMLSYRKDNMIEQGKCFDPHHAIILIRKGRLSYIDLCFGCENFSTSKDINLKDIEAQTWERLYAFFKSKGIKYSMSDNSTTPNNGF